MLPQAHAQPQGAAAPASASQASTRKDAPAPAAAAPVQVRSLGAARLLSPARGEGAPHPQRAQSQPHAPALVPCPSAPAIAESSALSEAPAAAAWLQRPPPLVQPQQALAVMHRSLAHACTALAARSQFQAS
jgi:hypothetical protein